MSHRFLSDYQARWFLLLAGDDSDLRRQQVEKLAPHSSELKEHEVLVVDVSRSEITTLHSSSGSVLDPKEIARRYRLRSDCFTASLVDENDTVRWVAPEPICFADLISVIEELPHREAENATRGPALSH